MVRHIAVYYVHGISTSRVDGWHLIDWHHTVLTIVNREGRQIVLHPIPITWEKFNHDAGLHPALDLIGDLAAVRDQDVRDYIASKLTDTGTYHDYWVVSHSLGTVLTQKALHSLNPSKTERRYKHLTIGSPLARYVAARNLSSFLGTCPPCVSHWGNLHGRFDVVCLSPCQWVDGAVPGAHINLPSYTRHAASCYRRSRNFKRLIQWFVRTTPR